MPATFTTPPDLLKDLSVKAEADAPIGSRTWYRCGGSAALLVRPSSVAQLSAVVARCNDRRVPLFVMGGGANLLISDKGVDGVVVKLDDPAFKQFHVEGIRLSVGAGYDLFTLVTETAKRGLDGLVHIAGIPGSVGGGVRMNAGGSFGEIGESVARVQLMSEEGQVYYRDCDDLDFGYRRTNILAPLILSVEFDMAEEDPETLMKRVKEIFLFKKTSQPMSEHSAGCAFKNPPATQGPGWPAGKLIDRAGLKGHRVGKASVSEVHANFIVAENGCTATEVLAVIHHVQDTVKATHGVSLERELIVWGE